MHNISLCSEKMSFSMIEHGIQVQAVDSQRWYAMAAEWQELLVNANCDSLFLQHVWLSAWWKVFENLHNASLFILTARDSNMKLIGALPLFMKNERCMGFPLRKLYLLGHGQSDVNDAPCINSESAHALVNFLLSNSSQWDAIELGEIDPNGSFMNVAQSVFIKYFQGTVSDDSACAWLSVKGEWPTFYETCFSGQKRKKLRAEWRHLNDAFTVSIRFVTDLNQEPDILNVMADIERDHPRASNSRPGALNDPALGRFLHEILSAANVRQWISIAILRCGDTDVAYQLWFRHRGRYCGYAMAYRANVASYGVGKLLLLHSMETHWGNGAEVFDFLRGSEEYKRQIACHSRQNKRLNYTSPAWRGRLQYWLQSILSPWLIKRIPELQSRLILADKYGWRCALGLRSAPVNPTHSLDVNNG